MENFNEQTSVLVKVIMKIFFHCINQELPDYLANMQVIERWFSYFAVILKAPVPQVVLLLG